MISYQPLWDYLKERDISEYALFKQLGISRSMISRMKNNGSISARSIENFCLALGCRADQVIEIIDEPDNPRAVDSPFRDPNYKKSKK